MMMHSTSLPKSFDGLPSNMIEELPVEQIPIK